MTKSALYRDKLANRFVRILITNFNLSMRAGTQLYVRDLAFSLRAHGHQPVVYAPVLGTVANELEAAGIPVVDDLHKLETPPDIIHGNQPTETMIALLFFPRTPGVYFCHTWRARLEMPPLFPRIQRYVGIDEPCYEHLLANGVAKNRARIILNFVDLARFKPRGPLPARPRRALVFSNYAEPLQPHLKVIRETCARNAVEIDAIGEGVGYIELHPELKLGEYDLVFAKGRAALEAMAVGSAVNLCDVWGLGPMVTTGEFDSLRRLNFGCRTLQERFTIEALQAQLARYNPRDAAEVSQKVRSTAGIDMAMHLILDVYEEAIAEYKRNPAPAYDELRAASTFVRHLQADYARHSALTMRLRNRFLKIPFVGPGLLRLRERRQSPNIL